MNRGMATRLSRQVNTGLSDPQAQKHLHVLYNLYRPPTGAKAPLQPQDHLSESLVDWSGFPWFFPGKEDFSS